MKNVVLQYKLKTEKRWKDYPGKDKLKYPVERYGFRLLSENRKKLLSEGGYEKVLKRFRQIEFFKYRK